MVAHGQHHQNSWDCLHQFNSRNGNFKLGYHRDELFPSSLAPLATRADVVPESDIVQHVSVIEDVVHGSALAATGGACGKADIYHAKVPISRSTSDDTDAAISPKKAGRRDELASPEHEMQLADHQQALN